MIKYIIRLVITLVCTLFLSSFLNEQIFGDSAINFSYIFYFPIVFALTGLIDEDKGFIEGLITGLKALIPGYFLVKLPYGEYAYFIFFCIILYLENRMKKVIIEEPKSPYMDENLWEEDVKREELKRKVEEAKRELSHYRRNGTRAEINWAKAELRDREWELQDYDERYPKRKK